MGVEIERRFLVGPAWKPESEGVPIEQGYLSLDPERVVRVRRRGDEGILTVKGAARDGGLVRTEVEKALTPAEVRELMPLTLSGVSKVRHAVTVGSTVWEVDVFSGANAGLVMAEVELPFADSGYDAPGWLGPEVTHDPRFTNAALAARPWSTWPEDERAPAPA